MKKHLALITLCSFQSILFAQNSTPCDTLVLKNGKTILAEIDKITDTEILYQRCADGSKGKRSTPKSFVKEIRSFEGIKNIADLSILPSATDSTQLWHITTKDGNDYIGTIVRQDATHVVIRTTSLGEISVPKSQIKIMEPVRKEQMVEGEFWYDSPHNTRYFFAPNGYGLRRGEGYYQNTWVLLNQVTYGFSDNFSLGLGTIPIFLFGAPGVPFWITPKFSMPIKKDKLNLGAGVLYANAIGFDSEAGGGAGMAYGVLTTGPRDRNLTFGLGYGFADGDWAEYPLVTISGMYRVSRKFSFLTENYLIPVGDGENFGVISVGGRYGGKSIALDFGLFRPILEDLGGGFWALPWLGINVPFGKPR
ncbi:MAG: hypothetical protein Q7T20_12110 [Saprospiraceae bacterium]|nr:hypothetical protein [Saprospiraceae bacterium]